MNSNRNKHHPDDLSSIGKPSGTAGTADSSVVSPLRQLLDAVNMSILPHDLRLSSISQACGFFDHRDRMTHDSELREGAAFILYQKLAFALSLSSSHANTTSMTDVVKAAAGPTSGSAGSKSAAAALSALHQRASADASDADHEIALLCSCLEMVHRASPDAIAATWYDIGEDILPLLVRVMERPFIRHQQAQYAARLEKMVEDNMTDPNLTSNKNGKKKTTSKKSSFHNGPIVNRDLKLAVQKVTKLLAMYSLVPEAKFPMAHCPGLLTVLIKIIDTRHMNRRGGGSGVPTRNVGAHGDSSGASFTPVFIPGLIMTEAARFNTIATLTNLAAAEENRITMLAEPSMVDNIARIVQNERSDVARQCSALALMNLSNGDKEHVPEMATELLLETLMTLMKDDVPETRRNAAVALFNVACADENTVRVAQFQNGVILDALMEVVSNDDHDDSRANAAETLFNMACSDAAETLDLMANHPGLLEALAFILQSQSATIDVKMYCAATLRRMAEIIRCPMLAQGALLTALVRASTWSRTPDIAEAMEVHAEFTDNRRTMAQHSGLLDCLAELALTPAGGPKQQQGVLDDPMKRAALSAIEKLARDEDARPLLAHNEGIMTALTRASYGPSGQPQNGEEEESVTSQGRMVQMALKNLVAAM